MKPKPKRKYRAIRILEADYMKIRKWAAIRNKQLVEIISLLVNGEK